MCSRPCSRSGVASGDGPTNAVVFEHVPVADLPEKWRAKLTADRGATVTVRIEEETPAAPAEEFVTDDPLFGMWRDREDMADVAGLCAQDSPAALQPRRLAQRTLTVLVGTDLLIWHLPGDPQATRRLDDLGALTLSAVSYLEVLQGMRNKAELLAVRRMLQHRAATLLLVSEAITLRHRPGGVADLKPRLADGRRAHRSHRARSRLAGAHRQRQTLLGRRRIEGRSVSALRLAAAAEQVPRLGTGS